MALPIRPRSPKEIILAHDRDFIDIDLEKFNLSPKQKELVQNEKISAEARFQILVRTFELALIESLVDQDSMPKSQLTFSHYSVKTSTGNPSLRISWTPDNNTPDDREWQRNDISTHARAKGAVLSRSPFSHSGYNFGDSAVER